MRCKSFRWIFHWQTGSLEELLLTAIRDTQAGLGVRAPALDWIKERLQALHL